MLLNGGGKNGVELNEKKNTIGSISILGKGDST